MDIQFEIDCALMAGASYISTRPNKNRFPVPQGWTEQIELRVKNDSSGFEATAFQCDANQNKIVISFAGTYPADILGDVAADLGLGIGCGSVQLLQAAEYYLSIKKDPRFQDANITFTGHSLGGGLAALMGVFFGKQAVTFDQAPFANSAQANSISNPLTELTPDIAADLKSDLLLKDYTEDDLIDLTKFLHERQENGGIPNADLISNIRVDGEFLSSLPPFSIYATIGSTPAIVLDHGPCSISSLDLHSQSLLTAFLQSKQSAANSDNPNQTLNEVTKKLTDLLGMIFDKNLYAFDTDKENENFLERLVRHEAGVQDSFAADAMVTRFTNDLQKLAQDGGLTITNNDLTKTLTAFAMQMYYENDSATDPDKELFTGITGGIRFDRGDVADTLANAKGYTMYFMNFLATLPEAGREAICQHLPELRDWYIQAGDEALNATAGAQRAFMLGGSGNDIMTGDSQDDLLLGLGGNDTLDGGAGADICTGGDGDDTFLVNGDDNAADSFLGGGDHDRILGGHGDDTIRVTRLDTENSIEEIDGGGGQNFIKGTAEADVIDLSGITVHNIDGIYGGAGQDRLTGTAGDDILYGGEGFDNVFGGEGKDTLYGDAGDDILNGGAGIDELLGGADNDRLYGDNASDTLYGDNGNDNLEGGEGDDNLFGGSDKDILYGDAGDDMLSGGAEDDVLHGGADNDLLEGDEGSDTLYGNDGNDWLHGDFNADKMYGGLGYDTYLAERSDTIEDTDGQGRVFFEATLLTGGTQVEKGGNVYQGDGVTYVCIGATLTVETCGDKLVISDFSKSQDDLGIHLEDKEDPPTPVAAPYARAQAYAPPRDPLAIDLDGDGVETVSSGVGVLFDHNGDHIATGTGWIKADDGLLARDINGNGTIDSGAELFGDQTQLAGGATATSGFAALRDLDSTADGMIDAADATFTELKVWRDLNQDGISQANELATPASVGITAIDLAAVVRNQGQNGNTIAATGVYTKADGTTGVIAEVNLADNTFSREFTDPVAIPAAIQALPDMTGSGRVRDLREAASLSPTLAGVLSRYSVAATRAEQMALVDELLLAWADTSGMAKSLDDRAQDRYRVGISLLRRRRAQQPPYQHCRADHDGRLA